MNHRQRRALSKILRGLRRKLELTAAQIATRLGWAEQFYVEAEKGAAGLSEGQQNDVRRLLKAERDKAAIRDELRAAPRRKRLVLP